MLTVADYVDQQKFVARLNSNVTVHNNNFIGIASFNIFVGIYVATIFGSAFFFDLFWPERRESQGVKMAWKVCSVFACMLTLACALAYTYIVASQSAYVTGTNATDAQRLLALYGGSPLKYSSNGRAIASVVFLWPGMIFTFVRYVQSPCLKLHRLTHPAPTYSGILWPISMPTARCPPMHVPRSQSTTLASPSLPILTAQSHLHIPSSRVVLYRKGIILAPHIRAERGLIRKNLRCRIYLGVEGHGRTVSDTNGTLGQHGCGV